MLSVAAVLQPGVKVNPRNRRKTLHSMLYTFRAAQVREASTTAIWRLQVSYPEQRYLKDNLTWSL